MPRDNTNLLPFDPEIERTCRRNLRAQLNQTTEMAEEIPKAIRDYFQPTLPASQPGIMNVPINVNNFELKPGLIQMARELAFRGRTNEDPHKHLRSFLEICGTVKMNGVSNDAIKLRLFPFSLQDRAKDWLETIPPDSITTWEILAQVFLNKYFPPAKSQRLRTEIGTFCQLEDEQLYEAWERYKDLLRRCPQHGYPDWLQIQLFYDGLASSTKSILDATAGWSIFFKECSRSLYHIRRIGQYILQLAM